MIDKGLINKSDRNESHGGHKNPSCPICGGKSARIIYGYVEPPPLPVAPGLVHMLNPLAAAKAAERSVGEWMEDHLWKRIRAGEVILGGCLRDSWDWLCYECDHRWTDETPNCMACGCDLSGAPKIEIDKFILCYWCAKEVYPEIKRDRFSQAELTFDGKKKAFEKTHQKWEQEMNTFVMQGRFMLIERIWFWAALGLGLLYAKVMFGLVIFILSPFIPIGISEYLTKTKLNNFLRYNVEPKFYEREPLEVTFQPEMGCCKSDGTKLKKSNYRPEILERDNFTCQSCSKLKPTKDLEVHHVIPKAKGGLDIPTNLITLCIPCHDQEDWFGHFRKHQTTI